MPTSWSSTPNRTANQAQIFLGTNAQQIVHNAQLPVLCVHPNDKIFTLTKS